MLPICTRATTGPRHGQDRSPHARAAGGAADDDAAAAGGAERAGDAGAIGDRADRDLFRGQARHRCAGRHGPGVPRRDADADDVGGCDGRRHRLGGGPRARRRQARRCERVRGTCAADQYRPRVQRAFPAVRAGDVPGHGRRRRRAAGRPRLFGHRLRRSRPAVDHERPGERRARHRQHAGAGLGDHRRRGGADPAQPVPDLWPGAPAAAGRGRRRVRAGAVLSGRHCGAGLVSVVRTRRAGARCCVACGSAGRCSATSSRSAGSPR